SDQINSAVQQLSQVTQQNAASSEELASSSEELASQASQLKEVIAFFKTGDNNQGISIEDIKKGGNGVPKAKGKKQSVLKVHESKGVELNMEKIDKVDQDFEKY
ncbi:MAG: chemotaxis protein, partial [Candidatus Delongbacteria bacterium]|nr:chemotaxis protein [Candidatus Delongbacteria bacterium]